VAGLSGRKHLLKRGAEFRPLPLLGDESGKVVREVEAMKRRALGRQQQAKVSPETQGELECRSAYAVYLP